MKTLQLGLALAMIVLFAGETRAQDGGELTRNKDCMTWHALEQEKTGTSFKSIAAQSKAQAEAAATLEAELKSGRGHVKAAATDAELQQMIASCWRFDRPSTGEHGGGMVAVPMGITGRPCASPRSAVSNRHKSTAYGATSIRRAMKSCGTYG